MKPTVVIGAAVVALVANGAEAFFMPAGAIAGGAFSTALLSSTSTSLSVGRQSVSTASHGAGCSCSSCSPRGAHGRSCTCPSCSSSAAVSGLSHGSGCRCGACSVRMQAHPEGCGCGDCSTTVGAFHGAACKCPTCVGSAHSVSCTCGACMASGRGKRAASSLTVMGMGAGQQEASELGEAATAFRQRLVDEPQSVVFEDTMAAVTADFDYTPKRFVNGVTSSDAGANEGSCKVFAFGEFAELSAAETLACFGEHYRSVVSDPSGDSHGNIRAFMDSGVEGVSFPDGLCLSVKKD